MIIGLSGKIGCGKSALAGLLNARLPVFHHPHSFADELKTECAMMLQVARSLLYSPEGKATEVDVPVDVLRHINLNGGAPVRMTLREFMQRRGRAARDCADGYWVYRLDDRIRHLSDVLVDDVRYPDEARYIRKRGGALIRLHPYEGWEPGPCADHESETALDDWQDWDLELRPPYGGLELAADEVMAWIGNRGSLDRADAPRIAVPRRGGSRTAPTCDAHDLNP